MYFNGNSLVRILPDGTRIKRYSGEYLPEQPDNIDVKITQFCDSSTPIRIGESVFVAGCMAHCHEKSNPNGVAGNLDLGFEVLKQLKGGEIAIGGGSTLSHPGLPAFLRRIKRETNIITNLTVNQYHVETQYELINELAAAGLFKGLGISYVGMPLDKAKLIKNCQVVWHLIAGIHTLDDAELLIKEFGRPNILILGYKEFGNGVNYYSKQKPLIDRKLKEWDWNIHTLFGRAVLGFDNLSVEQLRVRRFFSAANWNTFYQGDDGISSMYLDLVKEEFSKSSRSLVRFPLTKDAKFGEMLEVIKQIS